MNNVYDFLARLGTTPEEVKNSLLAKKCYGHRGSGEACPIAQALVGEFPDGTFHVTKTEGVKRGCYGDCLCYLPPACLKFVWQFDAGMYPELERCYG